MSCTIKFAIAAFAASAILAPASFAEGRAGTEQAALRVAYGDLDTSTQAGGKTLLSRIKVAARKVCDEAVPRSPLNARFVIVCRRETVEETVRQLDIGTLTLAWSGTSQLTTLASR
jgi:UrcA family protein